MSISCLARSAFSAAGAADTFYLFLFFLFSEDPTSSLPQASGEHPTNHLGPKKLSLTIADLLSACYPNAAAQGCFLPKLYVTLNVEFLLKIDSGFPKDTGIPLLQWQPLGIPSAVTPIGQLHQSPPSPMPGDLGRGPQFASNSCSPASYSLFMMKHLKSIR